MSRDDLSRIAWDPDAFDAFYRDHVEAVLRFVTRRVANPQIAADLTADIFVAVIGAASGYSPERGEPRPWLFGIARNVVSGQRRDIAREAAATQRVAGRRLLEDDDIERLQQRIDAQAQARDLYSALDRLPPSERAVLELVAVDELSITEVAAALDIRPVTARVRLHRARAAMRGRLSTASMNLTPTLEPK